MKNLRLIILSALILSIASQVVHVTANRNEVWIDSYSSPDSADADTFTEVGIRVL